MREIITFNMDPSNNLKNYKNCCRTCMQERSNMYGLFTENNSSSPADILTSCTNINVTKEDMLPNQICFHCYNCLLSFYNFRNLAESVDIKLRTKLCNTLQSTLIEKDTKDTLTVIKIECAIDEIKENDIQQEVDEQKGKSEIFDNKSDLEIKFCNENKEINETFLEEKPDVKQLLPLTKNECNDNEVDSAHINEFPCKMCDTTFKSNKSLSAHMIKHTQKGRVLSCSICSKVFKKVSHVKRHEKIHDINRPYKCSVCSKSFSNENILKEHINKHNGVKLHSCTFCSKSFAHLFTLKAHIKIHTVDKAFLCPTCGKKFCSSTNFKQHMKRHIGLKNFACTMCPKIFISKGELKSHTVTHTGERNSTCDQCGSSFTKNSSLNKHIRLKHLGLRPHHCDKCSMKFTTKDHLKRHYRSHTGEKPYKCDMCERAFSQSNDLVKHRRVHLGDKVYKCSECTQGFRLKYELQQHISEHYINSSKALTDSQKDVASSLVNHKLRSSSTDGAGSVVTPEVNK